MGKPRQGRGKGGFGGVSSGSPLGNLISGPGNASISRSSEGVCALRTELEVHWIQPKANNALGKTQILTYLSSSMLDWCFSVSIFTHWTLFHSSREAKEVLFPFSDEETASRERGPHIQGWVSPHGFLGTLGLLCLANSFASVRTQIRGNSPQKPVLRLLPLTLLLLYNEHTSTRKRVLSLRVATKAVPTRPRPR